MSYNKLRDFNKQRKKEYCKNGQSEDNLIRVNKLLQQDEKQRYKDLEETHPTIFVFGLPRSGTTFMTQLIANTFDIGYINNLIARFWLAPVTGIMLSKTIPGDSPRIGFESNYATTKNIHDIHDFGYFWRYWLKKESIQDILISGENENIIEWEQLKKTILNIHETFGKGWICKNIFGAYHLERFTRLLDKVLFIYIERDPVDVAISILDARKKFYSDPKLWWSTIPMEYHELKELPVEEQIAGQVVYLSRYYQDHISKIGSDRCVIIQYEEASKYPQQVIEKIRKQIKSLTDFDLNITGITPKSFTYRSYSGRAEKEIFKRLIDSYQR